MGGKILQVLEYETIFAIDERQSYDRTFNHVFNKDASLFLMTFATLTPNSLTTFSNILFGILLVPDLWIIRCMDLLHVWTSWESNLMGLRGKCISWSLSPYTWHPFDELRPDMILVVVGHACTRSVSFHRICNNIPMGDISGYALKLPTGVADEILAKKITRSFLSPLPKPAQSNSWYEQEVPKCQRICFGTKKNVFFNNISLKYVSRPINKDRESCEQVYCQGGELRRAASRFFLLDMQQISKQ